MCMRDVLCEVTALFETDSEILCRVGQTGKLILELKALHHDTFCLCRVLGRVQGLVRRELNQ